MEQYCEGTEFVLNRTGTVDQLPNYPDVVYHYGAFGELTNENLKFVEGGNLFYATRSEWLPMSEQIAERKRQEEQFDEWFAIQSQPKEPDTTEPEPKGSS